MLTASEYPRVVVERVRFRDAAMRRAAVALDPGDVAALILADGREPPGPRDPLGTPFDIFFRRILPYGYWTESDGARVVFNRNYEPIWRVRRDGSRERVRREVWIRWTNQNWHFGDSNPPWRDAATCRRVRAIYRFGDLADYRKLVAEIQATIKD